MAYAMIIISTHGTIWFHRYCTHRAYKFSHPAWARLFLWTNPVCFREESYVIPWMYPYLSPHGLIMKINQKVSKKYSPTCFLLRFPTPLP